MEAEWRRRRADRGLGTQGLAPRAPDAGVDFGQEECAAPPGGGERGAQLAVDPGAEPFAGQAAQVVAHLSSGVAAGRTGQQLGQQLGHQRPPAGASGRQRAPAGASGGWGGPLGARRTSTAPPPDYRQHRGHAGAVTRGAPNLRPGAGCPSGVWLGWVLSARRVAARLQSWATCANGHRRVVRRWPTVRRAAKVPQPLLQPLLHPDLAGGVAGGLGAQGAPLLAVLLDVAALVLDVQTGGHPVRDDPCGMTRVGKRPGVARVILRAKSSGPGPGGPGPGGPPPLE